MATTNHRVEENLMRMHPHMGNALTKFVTAMADVQKQRGKKSFLGKDKGLDAYKKFEVTLRDLLLSMVLDGLIERNLEADDCRRSVIDCVNLARDIWPNWPDAYSYAEEYLLDNATQTTAKIADLMKEILMNIIADEIIAESAQVTDGKENCEDANNSITITVYGETIEQSRGVASLIQKVIEEEDLTAYVMPSVVLPEILQKLSITALPAVQIDGKVVAMGVLDPTNEEIRYWLRVRKPVDKLKDDIPYGMSSYIWPNGDKYVGEWKDGEIHGQGTIVFANGNRYVGEWKDGSNHGQGTYIWAEGDKYVGEWKDDIQHGQGILTRVNGNKYVGEWKDGEIHGQGIETYANGDKYVGEWMDDMKHGQGTMIYANGDEYDGEWNEGEWHGRGIMVYADGVKHEGEWGKYGLHGHGTMTFTSGKKYEGEFDDFLPLGQCTITYANGNKYMGSQEGTTMHGQGSMVYANGDKYIGEWKYDMKHGKGTMTYANGDEYDGEWVDDMKHDEGILAKNKENKNITESEQVTDGKDNNEDADNSQPSTVEEATSLLINRMEEEEIEYIKNCSLENFEDSTYLSGYSQGIRNEFGLWGNNEKLLNDAKTDDADEASDIIIENIYKVIGGLK
jgi:hypothetical protein